MARRARHGAAWHGLCSSRRPARRARPRRAPLTSRATGQLLSTWSDEWAPCPWSSGGLPWRPEASGASGVAVSSRGSADRRQSWCEWRSPRNVSCCGQRRGSGPEAHAWRRDGWGHSQVARIRLGSAGRARRPDGPSGLSRTASALVADCGLKTRGPSRAQVERAPVSRETTHHDHHFGRVSCLDGRCATGGAEGHVHREAPVAHLSKL